MIFDCVDDSEKAAGLLGVLGEHQDREVKDI
jgi:hypothetical protein